MAAGNKKSIFTTKIMLKSLVLLYVHFDCQYTDVTHTLLLHLRQNICLFLFIISWLTTILSCYYITVVLCYTLLLLLLNINISLSIFRLATIR
jgi:hypothetical protein